MRAEELITSVVEPTEGLPRHWRRMPYRIAGGIAAGAATATWWISGVGRHRGPEHIAGPYRVPLFVEYFAAAVAAATFAYSCWWIGTARRGPHGVTGAACVLIAAAAASAAGMWRIVTAGYNGSDIFGGLVLVGGPIVLALPLSFAVLYNTVPDGRVSVRARLGVAAVWAGAVAAAAGLWFGLG